MVLNLVTYMLVVLLNAEVEYSCLSGVRRRICLERRTSQVRVLPEAALLFLLGKKELSSGVIACICLVSITDYTCTYSHMPASTIHMHM